jgi:predicted alpha/beta-fold hydrolase
VCIGYSLGSNVLLKYLGEEGEKTPVSAAVSISNPYNFATSADSLPHTYSKTMAQGLVAFFEKHREMLMQNEGVKGAIDSPSWRAKTLREFDDKVTSVAFGFKNATEYYENAGCYQYMDGISVPVLCISAADDPVVHPEAIPYQQTQKLPNIMIAVTDVGGHVGFPEGLWPSGRSWSDKLCVEFLAHVFTIITETKPVK